MAKSGIVLAFAAAITLPACDGSRSTSAKHQSEDPTPAKVNPLPTGYGEFKLGESFDQVLSKLDVSALNPLGLKECLDELAMRGCSVEDDQEKVARERRDGIPYWRGFTFNKRDRLTDISLSFKHEGDVTASECLDMHKRTLDWLTLDYGPFHSPVKSSPEKDVTQSKTDRNNVFLIWRDPKSDDFITQPARNDGRSRAEDRGRPIVSWDGDRYVSLMTTFIVVDGNPICDVSVRVSEPDKIERRVERASEKLPARS